MLTLHHRSTVELVGCAISGGMTDMLLLPKYSSVKLVSCAISGGMTAMLSLHPAVRSASAAHGTPRGGDCRCCAGGPGSQRRGGAPTVGTPKGGDIPLRGQWRLCEYRQYSASTHRGPNEQAVAWAAGKRGWLVASAQE